MLVVHTKGRTLVFTAVSDSTESIYSVRRGFVEGTGEVVVISYRVRKEVEAAVRAGTRKYTAKELRYGLELSKQAVAQHHRRVHSVYSVYA